MVESEIAGALGELGAATLGESGAIAMPPRLRPVWTGAAVAAPAFPVRCTPGDNLAVHVAVTTAPASSGGMDRLGAIAPHHPVWSWDAACRTTSASASAVSSPDRSGQATGSISTVPAPWRRSWTRKARWP